MNNWVLGLIGCLAFAAVVDSTEAQVGGGGSELSTAQLEKRCVGGNPTDCDQAGLGYVDGEGVAKDFKRANTLFQRACDGGESSGCYNLGWSYQNGFGLSKNPTQAAFFFQRACDGGHASGCAQLAFSYSIADGIKKDDAKAALYAERACNANASLGCYVLAGVYYGGVAGYPKDLNRAVTLFRRACNVRNPITSACRRLDELGYPRQDYRTSVAPPVAQGGLAPSQAGGQAGLYGPSTQSSTPLPAARATPPVARPTPLPVPLPRRLAAPTQAPTYQRSAQPSGVPPVAAQNRSGPTTFEYAPGLTVTISLNERESRLKELCLTGDGKSCANLARAVYFYNGQNYKTLGRYISELGCKYKHGTSCYNAGAYNYNDKSIPDYKKKSTAFYRLACTYREVMGCMEISQQNDRYEREHRIVDRSKNALSCVRSSRMTNENRTMVVDDSTGTSREPGMKEIITYSPAGSTVTNSCGGDIEVITSAGYKHLIRPERDDSLINVNFALLGEGEVVVSAKWVKP